MSNQVDEIEKVTKEDIVAAAKKVSIDTVYFMKGTLLDNENGVNDENEDGGGD